MPSGGGRDGCQKIGTSSSVTTLKRDSQIAMLVILSSNIGVAMECLFFLSLSVFFVFLTHSP